MLIKVNAENDANGNPRRGWIQVSKTGNFLAFHPEGHDNGGEVLRSIMKDTYESYPSINVTPKEYKRLSKLVA